MMKCSGHIELPFDFTLQQKIVNLRLVPAVSGLGQLSFCPDEVGAVIRSDFSHLTSTCRETSKALNEVAGVQAVSHFYEYSLCDQTRKKHAVPLQLRSTLCNKKGQKQSTMINKKGSLPGISLFSGKFAVFW